MTINNESVIGAFNQVDWTSVGIAAGLSAALAPGAGSAKTVAGVTAAVAETQMTKGAIVVTGAAMVADATTDITIEKGVQSVFNGEKPIGKVALDMGTSVAVAGIGSSVVKGSKNQVIKDLAPANHAPKSKADKAAATKVKNAVFHPVYQYGIESTLSFGIGGGNELFKKTYFSAYKNKEWRKQ